MCLLGSPRRWRVAVLVLTGVVFILSTFLLGVGLYYLLENCDTYCSFVELALPVALVLFAIISMLSAAVGYIGALFTNLLTIRLFAIFEIVIFVCQVCAALTFLQINEKLLPASVREIRALIAQAENSTVINRADVILENMQRRYQCCGGDNQSDWKNGPPLSCCVNPNYLDNTCKYPGIFVRVRFTCNNKHVIVIIVGFSLRARNSSTGVIYTRLVLFFASTKYSQTVGQSSSPVVLNDLGRLPPL
uniref:Transposase n=1 Tax=Mesocestoides corti TaxID=53468 RepID=A0A5K3FNI4_MESCO